MERAECLDSLELFSLLMATYIKRNVSHHINKESMNVDFRIVEVLVIVIKRFHEFIENSFRF